ncbi:hypothetical protein BJ170DRAFT_710803 [Xylariales sp. AK1849]|nr:hypothetical protein BJ170DRAFT_710803 [Xylariales sp. AK1849]
MADTGTIIQLLGYYDNFEEPEPLWNKQSTMIGLTVPFLTCAWICVIFRLYTRFKIVYAPGWDDALVLFFLVTGTINGICLCIASRFGFGQHLLMLTYDDMVGFLKSFYVSNASYSMSTALIKMSLLFQYLRVFDRGRLRLFCIGLLAFTGLWGLSFSILAWFPCNPISDYWSWKDGSQCWGFGSLTASQFYATYASHAVTNMVLDFIVLAIPARLYFRNNTSKSSRWRMLMLLSMGTLVSAISIWRLAVIVDHRAATYPTFDPTWYGPAVGILGMIEINAASICACVPVFWPVLTARIDHIFVTQEIKITRERRFSAEGDDEIELHDNKTGSLHSQSGSITSQSQMHLTKSGKEGHYMDDYSMEHVNPLRSKTTVVAVAHKAVSGGVERQKSQMSML